MLSTISVLVSIANGLFTLLKSIFGIKSTSPDVVTNAVEVSNKVGHVSAEVSRDTDVQLNKDLANATVQSDAAVDAVRSAGSVRAQQSAVDDAIARANAPAGSDH